MKSSAPSTFWDPAGETITEKTFEEECKKCHDDLKWYRNHPGHLQKRRRLFKQLIFLGIFIGVFIAYQTGEVNNIVLIIPFLFSLPYLGYIAYIHKLQTDLAKLIIAEKRNWIYNPEFKPERSNRLVKIIPSIFGLGHSEHLEDEFFGETQSRNQKYSFWLGKFQYTTGSGKHKRVHPLEVIAFHIPHPVKIDFTLLQDNAIFQFFNTLTKSDIDGESVEFNKNFRTNYQGSKSESETDIIRVLSPAVQTGLLDLKKRLTNLTVRFQKDMILFSGTQLLPSMSHTDFFKKLDVDPRDEEKLDDALNQLLNLVDEIVKYIG